MARGVSTKLLTTLPAKYTADWLERIDRRTKLWRALLPRIHRLEEESGGADNLTHAKRSMCRRAAFLELLCETQELRFTAGEPCDVGAYTQAFNSMQGAYRALNCLERREKPAMGLHEFMAAKTALNGAAADAAEAEHGDRPSTHAEGASRAIDADNAACAAEGGE
ncbi:MAG TPA: hypothetical protein VN845_03250 [Solirubrobacteraceae bacterium]|nr:hypothetical protein [Solirubrobacteraceae bacterium]